MGMYRHLQEIINSQCAKGRIRGVDCWEIELQPYKGSVLRVRRPAEGMACVPAATGMKGHFLNRIVMGQMPFQRFILLWAQMPLKRKVNHAVATSVLFNSISLFSCSAIWEEFLLIWWLQVFSINNSPVREMTKYLKILVTVPCRLKEQITSMWYYDLFLLWRERSWCHNIMGIIQQAFFSFFLLIFW